jgi:hypothetical protein
MNDITKKQAITSPDNYSIIVNLKIMGNLLYLIVIILITAWSILFIGYGIGGLIHVLPVLAIITVILRFRLDKRILRNIN